jgi:hypothetical protein
MALERKKSKRMNIYNSIDILEKVKTINNDIKIRATYSNRLFLNDNNIMTVINNNQPAKIFGWGKVP